MTEATVMGIFPVPVFLSKIEREFTPLEKTLIFDEDRRKNIGNKISKDSYVLDRAEFEGLREFVQANLDAYIRDVCRPREGVEVYITQSWVNYSGPGESHHLHMHHNSFLSGVLYLDAEREHDSIVFSANKHHVLRLMTDDYTQFNSDTWRFHVGAGDIVIFPSTLSHFVDPVAEDRKFTRVSLAFNSFLRGKIGNLQDRIYLELR